MAIQMGSVECGGVTVLHMPCQALFKGAVAGISDDESIVTCGVCTRKRGVCLSTYESGWW